VIDRGSSGGLPDRVGPMTPQLALRVAMVGGLALVLFAVVFFRLWFLQVLSGSSYVAQAQGNIVRTIPVSVSRGEILGLNGQPLVTSTPVPSVVVSPPSLPTPVTGPNVFDLACRAASSRSSYCRSVLRAEGPQLMDNDLTLFNTVAKLLSIPTTPISSPCAVYGAQINGKSVVQYFRLPLIACEVAQSVSEAPFQTVTIQTDVAPDIRDYLLERQPEFPGIEPETTYVRGYPLLGAGAQVFGTVQQMTASEYKQRTYPRLPEYDSVGQSGLEYEYNSYLQGIDGSQQVKVNAQGVFEGYGKETLPQAGDNLKTSLSAALETAGENSLQHSIAVNAADDGGAFVAMDPQNGQVYAMGSAPTYKPSLFTKPLTKASAAALFQNLGDPLENRAVQDAGPDGSTFKPITAIAALQSGVFGVNETYDDTGEYCFDEVPKLCLRNAGNAAYGTIGLEQAIQVSDDVFFYNLGDLLQFNPIMYPNGGPLQKWAREFGIGQNPGIDLPNADVDTGTLPTPNYIKALYKEEIECQNATGPFAGIDPLTHRHYPKQPGGCGISNTPLWTVGANVESGVGQGDDQVSPLQLAVAYAALANGGTIVTPHIGEDIQTNNGDVQQRIDPGAKRHLKINRLYLNTILAGLRAAASQPGGTSDDVMGSFPEQVYGKTGTAVLADPKDPNNPADDQDYAWYACFVPASATRKPIVVVVWVPKGGFGDVAAAPVARQILNQWFFGKPGPYHSGVSVDT
jgi:penicillin-binding protein 2